MNETERMLIKQIIKLEKKIDECMGSEEGMRSNWMKMYRHQVRYISDLLKEGKKPKHPLE